MLPNFRWVPFVIVMSSFNLGTILDKKDPITKTQTDPISYKDKMEEIKDGEKGAPSPSFEFYPKKLLNLRFRPEIPMVREKEEEKKSHSSAIPEMGEPIPEDVPQAGPSEQEEIDLTDWKENPEMRQKEKEQSESLPLEGTEDNPQEDSDLFRDQPSGPGERMDHTELGK